MLRKAIRVRPRTRARRQIHSLRSVAFRLERRRAARGIRHVITAARPLLLVGSGRTAPPRSSALRNSQKAFDAVPRHTLATALRAGVVPRLLELRGRAGAGAHGAAETHAGRLGDRPLPWARAARLDAPDDLEDTPENAGRGPRGAGGLPKTSRGRSRRWTRLTRICVQHVPRRSSSRSRPSSRRQK